MRCNAQEHRKAALTEADRRVEEERKAALSKWARAEEQAARIARQKALHAAALRRQADAERLEQDKIRKRGYSLTPLATASQVVLGDCETVQCSNYTFHVYKQAMVGNLEQAFHVILRVALKHFFCIPEKCGRLRNLLKEFEGLPPI